jgi:hypothetical protein
MNFCITFVLLQTVIMTINTINSVYYFRLSSEKLADAAIAVKDYIDRDLKGSFRFGYRTNLLALRTSARADCELQGDA